MHSSDNLQAHNCSEQHSTSSDQDETYKLHQTQVQTSANLNKEASRVERITVQIQTQVCHQKYFTPIKTWEIKQTA